MKQIEDWLIIKNKMEILNEVHKREERREILDDVGILLKDYKIRYYEKFDYFNKPEDAK